MLAHPNDRMAHQETLEIEFSIPADGNWLRSLAEAVQEPEETPQIITE